MPYKLSNDKRSDVISMIKAGKGTKDIVQATGVSKAQVVRMKKEHDPDRIKSRGGRVSIVSNYTKRVISFRVRKGFLLSAKDVQRYLWSLGYKLYYSSTTRLMRSLGLNSLYKKKKPLIKRIHQKKRLQWARKHRNWTVEDWNRFHPATGVLQGSILSPFLYSQYINGLPRTLRTKEISDNSSPLQLASALNCLLYADDVVLIASQDEMLCNLLSQCERYSFELGFRWNP